MPKVYHMRRVGRRHLLTSNFAREPCGLVAWGGLKMAALDFKISSAMAFLKFQTGYHTRLIHPASPMQLAS